MQYRIWNWGLLLLLMGTLVWNGCGSSHRRQRTLREKSSPEAAAEPDWPAEKLAKAHAHYGAGVIHEMNNEEEAALEEFRQAALNDPDNEQLVLEVSHRFIQNKALDKALGVLLQASSRPRASGAIYARLGLVYGQLGKTEMAIAADRTAIKRSPDLLSGYQNLFTTLLQSKQQQEALKVLDAAASQQK